MAVNDILKFCAAVMDAKLGNHAETMSDLSKSGHNPLREMEAILNDYYWTRPHEDSFNNAAKYRLGWFEALMPTSMVSWGSWNKTLADNVGPDEYAFRDEHILGQESENRLLYKSTGCGFCGASSVNLFPESRSAVVVLSSGLNCGDAADLVASVYIQELFDLKPRVDLLPVVKHEVLKRLEDWEQITHDFKENRDTSQPECDHSELVGEYRGLGITISIREISSAEKMVVCFNGREDFLPELEYYNVDQYSYWPKSRDEWCVILCHFCSFSMQLL